MPRNTSASIHQRLLNQVKETGRPFNELLQYFAMERFLYRLSQSKYKNEFVLKGALLFRIWSTPDSRATRDIDFLGHVENSTEGLIRIVQQILTSDVPGDGLAFDSQSVRAERIKEDADYEGVRLRLDGRLGNARVHLQIDVGFGDVVHPSAVESQYPTLLDHRAPILRTYPPETVVAEKVEAMVHLGGLNSRFKDFYDIWRLARQQAFDGEDLQTSIEKTFENRSTDVVPFEAVQEGLLQSGNSEAQWKAFLEKSNLSGPASFTAVLDEIGTLLSPVLESILNRETFEGTWNPPGPWRTRGASRSSSP